MSGVRRLRQANGEPILQDGPKSSSIIRPNPQTDVSGFWHEHSQKKTGGDVSMPPRKTSFQGYAKNTPSPEPASRPARGEGPSQNVVNK